MGWMFLGINNYDKYKDRRSVESMAQKNLNSYKQSEEIIKSLGKNETLINNIEDMRNKLNDLLANGSVEKDNPAYNMMMNNINQADSIQSKPASQRGLDDISHFYCNYEDFQNFYNRKSKWEDDDNV